jgi:hypothetical protein
MLRAATAASSSALRRCCAAPALAARPPGAGAHRRHAAASASAMAMAASPAAAGRPLVSTLRVKDLEAESAYLQRHFGMVELSRRRAAAGGAESAVLGFAPAGASFALQLLRDPSHPAPDLGEGFG